MGHVGQEIRRLREDRGLNQAELAVLIGTGPAAISRIENGKQSPNSATLLRLAQALGAEVADLFPKGELSLPLEGPQEETAAERRNLLALLEMPTNLMTTLAFGYGESVADLRDDLPYEDSLRTYRQWVYQLLYFCGLLEGELNTARFVEAVDPWVTRVERGEPVPEEVRERVLAFKQAHATLFGEVAPAASRWVQKQKERFPNDRELAQISADVLAEGRRAEEAEASRSVPEARESRVRR